SCHSGVSGCTGSEVHQWAVPVGLHIVNSPEMIETTDEREDHDRILTKISPAFDVVRLIVEMPR
ncbi:MAG: hypothetical protein ACI38Y_04620, partial [Candidatus Methanomethylophilaceae archaeon]